ncbi:MAG: lytic murein transglycosylase [Patescibacteria group bacterium]|nr:lytic murein transglycosylase [Patescibacteria group bacterium]MCL5257886.1 lytic murein transglycosylase [Patescibacteria group bacterium]
MRLIEEIKKRKYDGERIGQRFDRQSSAEAKLVFVKTNRPSWFKLNQPFRFNWQVGLVFLGVVIIILGLNSSTAAPTGPNYFSYEIKDNLLAQAVDIGKLRSSLQNQLQSVLKEISGYKVQINTLQSQNRSLSEEIAYLEAEIHKTELEIEAVKLEVADLQNRVVETKQSISQTQSKIDQSKTFLVASIRYYYQLTRKSILEVFLANETLSNYFDDFVFAQKLQSQISTEIDSLKKLEASLAYQKQQLESQLQEQSDLFQLATVKKQELQKLDSSKQTLLTQTQGQESRYQSLLVQKEKTAAQIRAQLYQLAGGSGAITFGDALKLAQYASNLTGIRPAFLLAILDYETRLGQNVGSCHYQDAMSPDEQPDFLKITTKLGLDPDNVYVSCKPWYGWGGAMGPAQFIPSTWLEYSDRVSALTGDRPPSPWNNLDAFTAAAIKLTDAGAAQQTYDAEWKAAMIYFAGSNWSLSSLSFYGDDVMSIASRYQTDINTLNSGQ